jgi:hypothetical protein
MRAIRPSMRPAHRFQLRTAAGETPRSSHAQLHPPRPGSEGTLAPPHCAPSCKDRVTSGSSTPLPPPAAPWPLDNIPLDNTPSPVPYRWRQSFQEESVTQTTSERGMNACNDSVPPWTLHLLSTPQCGQETNASECGTSLYVCVSLRQSVAEPAQGSCAGSVYMACLLCDTRIGNSCGGPAVRACARASFQARTTSQSPHNHRGSCTCDLPPGGAPPLL